MNPTELLFEPGEQNIMAWLTGKGGQVISIFKICKLRGRDNNVRKKGTNLT